MKEKKQNPRRAKRAVQWAQEGDVGGMEGPPGKKNRENREGFAGGNSRPRKGKRPADGSRENRVGEEQALRSVYGYKGEHSTKAS